MRLPSLRERGEDVLALAAFFLDLYVREYGLPSVDLAPEARAWLLEYAWPGNVRELQNLMERAVLLSGGRPILPAHFLLEGEEWPLFAEGGAPLEDRSPPSGGEPESAVSVPPAGNGGDVFAGGVIPLHEMERILIGKGLAQTGGNRTQAAELLGISVRTLRNKLNEYREAGIRVE